jgi:glycosyltransferase involved in cell wall biosynthesis
MRILFQHRTLADGAEGIHINAMVKAFRTLGHEVRVSGLGASQGSSRNAVLTRAKSLLPQSALELGSAACNVSEYVDLRREIRAFQPDILYKRHARYDVAVGMAAHHCGIPLILEVNCLYVSPQYLPFEPLVFYPLARRFERRALELATVVLAVSTPLARQIKKVTDANVVIMPNGADPERFDARLADPERVRARHCLGPVLTIGWTGIIREWHGLDILLDAFASIPDVQLLIIGDGPALPAVQERMRALRIDNRVFITGRVSHSDMRDYIAAMDIAVVADDGTGVASPMKLLEYMAMGRAIVAPDLDNLNDLVTDEIDALMFAAGDSGDLARVLRRLVAEAPVRHRLGLNARSKVVKERNWLANAAAVLAMIRQPDSAPDALGTDSPIRHQV